MYRCVLVPLDGSSFSEQALAWAAPIARRVGARMRLVLVHTPLTRYAADIAPIRLFSQWDEEHRDREARYLDGWACRLKGQGLEVEAETLDGDAALRLVERISADTGPELVVMATHGRGGLERAWVGSVADEVVRHVRVPVLLVRPTEPEPEDEAELRHVVAATDGSPAGEAAVAQGVQLAGAFGCRLTLLRVVSFPAGLASPYIPHAAEMDRETAERREQEAEAYLARTAAGLDTGAAVRTWVGRGYHPARAILTALAELNADLLTVGTHRRNRLARMFLGSVADKVVRAAPVPVLVAHADDRADESEAAA